MNESQPYSTACGKPRDSLKFLGNLDVTLVDYDKVTLIAASPAVLPEPLSFFANE